jgi:hypothetical protein
MTLAAETIAWFVLGGERDDHYCPFRTPRTCFLWIVWEAATRRMRR